MKKATTAGQIQQISLDGLRAAEIITGMHLMADYRGVSLVRHSERKNRFGEDMGNYDRFPGEPVSVATTVTEVVKDIMATSRVAAYSVKPSEGLRIDLCKKYGIPYSIDADEPIVEQFTAEDLVQVHY